MNDEHDSYAHMIIDGLAWATAPIRALKANALDDFGGAGHQLVPSPTAHAESVRAVADRLMTLADRIELYDGEGP